MKQSVLVLNYDFSPLSVCSVERAFVLVYRKKSEMLVPSNGHKLRSVTKSFPMPSVIRLLNYVNVPYRSVQLTRQNIFKRDNFSCQYCGKSKELTLDHVLPKSRGGKSVWTNLITACKRCNTVKGDNTPEEAGITLKSAPYKPTYLVFLRDFSGHYQEEWNSFLNYKLTTTSGRG
ncbi:MAG: HNH endonuclease [Candidatus Cyclobacteriaceae bacterium M2_1C_046]